jgi:hypothetical protein
VFRELLMDRENALLVDPRDSVKSADAPDLVGTGCRPAGALGLQSARDGLWRAILDLDREKDPAGLRECLTSPQNLASTPAI